MIDVAKLAEPGSPEELLVRRLDLARLPRHVAIIMDGNGRWAQHHDLPRVEGHRAGVESVRDTVESAMVKSLSDDLAGVRNKGFPYIPCVESRFVNRIKSIS